MKPKHKLDTLRGYVLLDRKNFTLMSNEIYCQCCSTKIDSSSKSRIQQHISSKGHAAQNSLNLERAKTQQSLLDMNVKEQDVFNKDLLELFVGLDVPLAKLDSPVWKKWASKYQKMKTPSRSTLAKKYIPQVFAEVRDKIREEIGENYFYAVVDESTDSSGKAVLNILLGVLDGQSAHPARLICSKVLETVNAETVSKIVDEEISGLLGLKSREKLLLLLSDAAAYMKKCGRILKTFYVNMVQVTCIVHALHNTSQKVQELFELTNKYLSVLKLVFLKSRKRIQHYKAVEPNLRLPPDPAPTRFGTWLAAVEFSCQNFETLENIVDTLPEDTCQSECVNKLKNILGNDRLKLEVTACSSMFSFLPRYISKLESNTLTLNQQLDVLSEVEEKLKSNRGPKAEIVKKKFSDVVSKNTGLTILKSLSTVLSGEDAIENEQPADPTLHSLPAKAIACFKYAQLTSCDVERSFSKRKAIFRDNRRKFDQDNLNMYLVINHYHSLQFDDTVLE